VDLSRLFAALLLLVAGCAHWDKSDKALGATFVAGQALNYSQTMYVCTEDDWREINPVMNAVYGQGGRAGVVAWKAGTTALILAVADMLDADRRKMLLSISNAVVWSFVAHDAFVGVGFSW